MSTAGDQGSLTLCGWRVAGELAAIAALLFVVRFVGLGHLIPLTEQECHIGGIAVDVLAHGVRFPLLAYAPNEYDNGSFFSGLLAAASFLLLGRNVLALKLVTHLISAAGALATVWLLRACLAELRLGSRASRWSATAVALAALALAPRVVTHCSLHAVGNHAEGSAIDTLLLLGFVRGFRERSAFRRAGFWVVVGLALYLNKGTFLVIPVLALGELLRGGRSPRPLGAMALGFGLGLLPELLVIAQRRGAGWLTMAAKAERNVSAFPRAFFADVWFLAEQRLELLGLWAMALLLATLLVLRAALRPGRVEASNGPVALVLVTAVSWLHLGVLALVAQGGIDAYAVYGYPTAVVLQGVLVGWVCARAARGSGRRTGALAALAAVALSVLLYRPQAWSWSWNRVAALRNNRSAAACAWRFAEGFEREQRYGLAPAGRTREQHAIARCRSLAERDLALDCAGGIARELHWRSNGRVEGEPPPELSEAERRAYAFHYGTHRRGDGEACTDFADADLRGHCRAAVELECLVTADRCLRLVAGRELGRPRCTIAEPPFSGYWAAMHGDLFSRAGGVAPGQHLGCAEGDLRSCQPVFAACFGAVP